MKVPQASRQEMGLPALNIPVKLNGKFDYIHLFVKDRATLEKQFPKLKKHLAGNGMLWISWPKGGQLDTDLTLKKVVESGYSYGLVESICLSIDTTWSALKFTHPKKGKIYNNSHAKLNKRMATFV